jgi:type IV pilus assembly protein PilN
MSGMPTRVGLAAPTTFGDASRAGRLAPVRINLLPHREARREQRKKDFVVLAGLVAIAGAVVVFAGGVVINQQISAQQELNAFITAENGKLEKQITEIKTLRDELAALRARREAVENLQSDRTIPVRLFDELVRLTPDGLLIRQLRQDDARISLVGHAQSNERVAELLRNLAEGSPWLERPELGEIKEVALQVAGQKEPSKVYEFSLNALIKRSASRPEVRGPGAKTAAVQRPPLAAAGAPATTEPAR